MQLMRDGSRMFGKMLCWLIRHLGGDHNFDRPLGTWVRICRRCGHADHNLVLLAQKVVLMKELEA